MLSLGLFLLFFYSSIRGIGQGIEMYLPSNRIHPWFGWYHWIRVAEALALIAATIAVREAYLQVLNIWLVCGVFFLCWELFEMAYAKARLGQCREHENVLGLGYFNQWFVFDGIAVTYLHAGRRILGIGAMLLWWF
jgi:hypothetical protein